MAEALKVIVEEKSQLGEGCVWHCEKNLLYWVDINGQKLHIYNPKDKSNKTINLGVFVGCVVPRQSGGLVLELHNGFVGFDLETETYTYLVDPESHLPFNRFNDGKCDPSGRFLAGTMAIDESPHQGTLYSLDTDLSIKHLQRNISVSNGLGWSPDYQTLYFIDSPTKNIFAFDYNLDTGTINNRSVAVTIPDGFVDGRSGGWPDGMTVDEEGMIWVALWAGYKVTRWNPKTGELLQIIDIPAPNVTCCTFGGENLDELYITTARQDMDQSLLERYPQAGSVFKIKTSVKGMKTFEFRG